MIRWVRRPEKGFKSYEVSSKGDSRFSAFNAILHDGRSIEMHYQCDIKGFDVGGTNWRLGKGKPPIMDYSEHSLLLSYIDLWKEWVDNNIPLMRELYRHAVNHDYTLSDCFASTHINQAHALSLHLNRLCERRKL